MTTVKLLGGSHDGETLKIDKRREIIYLQKKITLAESALLKINENIAWRPPEDVYVRKNEKTYLYRETVVYGPPQTFNC
jgi:hypothetical protein